MEELKYIGVIVDAAHATYVVGNTEGTLSLLIKIMPNIGGPAGNKRMVLGGITHSQASYTAPAWMEVWGTTKDMLERIQRRTLLRVASGYKTIWKSPKQVITEERLPLQISISGNLTSTKARQRQRTLVLEWVDRES